VILASRFSSAPTPVNDQPTPSWVTSRRFSPQSAQGQGLAMAFTKRFPLGGPSPPWRPSLKVALPGRPYKKLITRATGTEYAASDRRRFASGVPSILASPPARPLFHFPRRNVFGPGPPQCPVTTAPRSRVPGRQSASGCDGKSRPQNGFPAPVPPPASFSQV